MKKRCIAALLSLLLMIACFPVTGMAQEQGQEQETAYTVPQIRMYFEHGLLPKVFYQKPEDMIFFLQNSSLYMLWEKLAEKNNIPATYREEDYITHEYTFDDSTTLMQVELPRPDANMLCYRIYFLYNPDTKQAVYYTAEYDETIPDTVRIWTWDEDKNHEDLTSKLFLDKDDYGYEDDLKAEAAVVLKLSKTAQAKDDSQASGLPADDASGLPADDSADSADAPAQTGDAAGAQAEDTSGAQTDDVTTGSTNADAPAAGMDGGSAGSSTAAPSLPTQVDDALPAQTENALPAQTGGAAPGGTGEDALPMSTIDCPEQGFSVKADPSFKWDYLEGTGLSIYPGIKDAIPYVIVYRGEDLIREPFEYIKEQMTPYMQNKYGDALATFQEIKEYEIGGKVLPAGLYTYTVQGTQVQLLRIYDSTGDQTIAYSAKYIKGHDEDTLKALDTAIRTFQVTK